MAGLALGPMSWPNYGVYGRSNVHSYGKTRRRSGRANRHRWKRGGRFKNSARAKCLLGMNQEKKFIDLAQSDLPIVTGNRTLLSVIPQGDGESERIGRKAVITDILIKGHIHLATAATNVTANRVRIAVVQDRSTNGVGFSPSTLFATAGTSDIDSYRDLSFLGRYNVLFDKVYTMNTPLAGDGTTAAHGEVMRDVHINIKCCIPIEYDSTATTGAIGTQQVNSVHLVTWEEASAPGTAFHHVSRVRYLG